MQHEPVVFNAQGYAECRFQSREILIELSEKTKTIVQRAQIDGSFGE
ncbi:MAG TPA: hypothetical protein VFA29_14265 [Candidatus Baltobacteraceae bacterium]|nr:hypothetical protein [Candidatus Baltobacteraceae bacterium]